MSTASLSASVRTETGKGAARKIRQAGDIPAVIYGHGREAQSLVLNARDALREAGRITVSTRVRELATALSDGGTTVPAGRYVALTVADNGTGIDPETARHLFEPFHTTKPAGHGTGLGLAISERLARLMGV